MSTPTTAELIRLKDKLTDRLERVGDKSGTEAQLDLTTRLLKAAIDELPITNRESVLRALLQQAR